MLKPWWRVITYALWDFDGRDLLSLYSALEEKFYAQEIVRQVD